MPYAATSTATQVEDAGRYQRHRPEQTLPYRIVEEYYPTFAAHLAERDRELPGYEQREFDDYLKCGRLEHGFLRVRCDTCHTEHLVAFSSANAEASAPVAGRDAWPRVQRCWSMKFCPNSPCASGS